MTHPKYLFTVVFLWFFALAVPCSAANPGDFDLDGDVDATDFRLYVEAWRQSHQPGGTVDPRFDLGAEGRPGPRGAAIFLDILLSASTIASDPFADAVRYPGPPPTPGNVTFKHDGIDTTVSAFPGQVQVILDTPIPANTARSFLQGLGGTVLAQIPGVGYYLVGVGVGQESAYVDNVRKNTSVYLAFPHLAGLYGAVGATVVDDCDGSHGAAVQKVLTDRGVTINACRDDGDSRPISTWTIWETEKEISERKTQPTLINISSYQGLADSADWANQPPTVQRRALVEYEYDRKSLLKTISQMPLFYRDNLVITLCAGNNHMPLDTILAEILADPALAGVLRNNVLIVGSKGQDFSNYASLFLDDFAWVSNPESANGTSFAAPYALALISKIMDQRGVTASEALQIAKQAAAANPNHELVESEVLPVAPGDVYKGSIAGETTDTVDGSVWKAEISLALTVTVSGNGQLIDPYQVKLDFEGTLVETLIQCADPGGCDPGGTYPVSGTGQQTSLGKIIGTALLDGNDDGLTVKLTDGTLNLDGTKLTGTVTVDSFSFDAPVTKQVTFTLKP